MLHVVPAYIVDQSSSLRLAQWFRSCIRSHTDWALVSLTSAAASDCTWLFFDADWKDLILTVLCMILVIRSSEHSESHSSSPTALHCCLECLIRAIINHESSYRIAANIVKCRIPLHSYREQNLNFWCPNDDKWVYNKVLVEDLMAHIFVFWSTSVVLRVIIGSLSLPLHFTYSTH